MRRFLGFIGLLLAVGVTYIILLNHTDYVNISYLHGVLYTMDPEKADVTVPMRISTFGLGMLFCGFIIGSGMVSLIAGVQKDRLNSYKRELEKASVTEYANSSKVKTLEAKIQTLEKAFNTVADERTKLELQIKQLNDELENMNNK